MNIWRTLIIVSKLPSSQIVPNALNCVTDSFILSAAFLYWEASVIEASSSRDPISVSFLRLFSFVVRLNNKRHFGSFLQKWAWCGVGKEKGKGPVVLGRAYGLCPGRQVGVCSEERENGSSGRMVGWRIFPGGGNGGRASRCYPIFQQPWTSV